VIFFDGEADEFEEPQPTTLLGYVGTHVGVFAAMVVLAVFGILALFAALVLARVFLGLIITVVSAVAGAF
jgi:hypothetical protein